VSYFENLRIGVFQERLYQPRVASFAELPQKEQQSFQGRRRKVVPTSEAITDDRGNFERAKMLEVQKPTLRLGTIPLENGIE
jgi:hypothetical protein